MSGNAENLLQSNSEIMVKEDAVAFVAGAYQKDCGTDKCGYAARLYALHGALVSDWCDTVPDSENKSMALAEVYAVMEVLHLCEKMGFSVKIIYSEASAVFNSLDADKELRLKDDCYREFYELYDSVKENGISVSFVKTNKESLSYTKVKVALMYAGEAGSRISGEGVRAEYLENAKLLDDMCPEQIYLTLTQALAAEAAGIPDVSKKTKDYFRKHDIEVFVRRADRYICISTKSENPFERQKTAGQAEAEREGEQEQETGKKPTVLDLIFQYAETVKKKRMSNLHLLYGYICVSLMDDKTLCEKLQADEADEVKIIYTKKKLEHALKGAKIDSVIAREMFPRYMEEIENIEETDIEYQKALQLYEKAKRDLFSTDIVACHLLNKILSDEKLGAQKVYQKFLKENHGINISSAAKNETEKIMPLGEISGTASKLYKTLTSTVYGQEKAVQRFVKGICNYQLSRENRKGKPAAAFLFAGPPGVGKTYLAQTAAKVLDLPYQIYDMTEYAHREAEHGLIGFEYTYFNSQSGKLTKYVEKNPKCVLIIDEIEKANMTIKMLFLQILEGARLSDKHTEREVSFEDVILIFTTNAGKELYLENEETDLSDISEADMLKALQSDGSFPMELCSRFAAGNMIMFRQLSPYYLTQIIKAKFDKAVTEMEKRHGIKVSYDSFLPELFLFHMGAGNDARVLSSKGGEFVKEQILNFAEHTLGDKAAGEIEAVRLELTLNQMSEEVREIMVNTKEQAVLFVTDSYEKIALPENVKGLYAGDLQEMKQMLHENHVNAAIVDLRYRMTDAPSGINAMGIDSEGVKCFEALLENQTPIPVYIMNHAYGAAERKDILLRGASQILEEAGTEAEKRNQLQELLDSQQIQKSMSILRRRGQKVHYKERYYTDGKTGVIEFYRLKLAEEENADVSLRRAVKQSKIFDYERPAIRFKDVIGAKQAKAQLKHFMQYIAHTEKYLKAGVETPKGALLYGPPGTGKTSLAKAFAGECDALFLNTTGAKIRNAKDAVQELENLFKIASQKGPAIIFIDEFDAIAKKRTGYEVGTELLVNTLLELMDGFLERNPLKPVFVIAATNYEIKEEPGRQDVMVIDPAVVRRFDGAFYIGLPERAERYEYIQMQLKKKACDGFITENAMQYLVQQTGGKSLAFLKQVLNDMVKASIDCDKKINDALLTEALEARLYGETQEKSKEYRLEVARHEAGHAYVAWKLGREAKFITIEARGGHGGYVSFGDGEDIMNVSKEEYLNRICCSLAGRAAEMFYYGEKGRNTGAASDIKTATNAAIAMICNYGMGSLGTISVSPETILNSPKAGEILDEAKQIAEEQLKRAMELVKAGEKEIDAMVQALLDKSYMQAEELKALLG